MPYRNSEFVEEKKKKEPFKGFQPKSYLYYLWVILSWIPTCFIRLFRTDEFRSCRNHVLAWTTIYLALAWIPTIFIPCEMLLISISLFAVLILTVIVVVPIEIADNQRRNFLYLIDREKIK